MAPSVCEKHRSLVTRMKIQVVIQTREGSICWTCGRPSWPVALPWLVAPPWLVVPSWPVAPFPLYWMLALKSQVEDKKG